MLTYKERKRLEAATASALKSGRVNHQFMRAVCVDCTFDPEAEGTPIEQVRACSVTSCVIHPLRHLWSAERRKK